jgi:hypothetical protein
MPLYHKVPAEPVTLSAVAVIRPSLSGTQFNASYTTTLTSFFYGNTTARFLTQASISTTRLQTVASSGNRHNLGPVTAITNNGSLTFTLFRSTSDNPIAVVPLDTGSPTTGTTFISQKSDTAFTVASGSYYIATSGGLLGPYSMTLADSDFTLQFSYDSAYLTWATSSSTAPELIAGLPLVSAEAGSLSTGIVYYLADKILRIV